MKDLKKVNTAIIGGGQAALSLSFYLTKKGINHLVFEQGRVGESWRSKRWDSFHLITPNYMTKLPGFSYQGKNPDGFDSRDKVINCLESYAKSFSAPLLENTQVLSISKQKNSFLVKTTQGNYLSKNVVIAIGSFHKPLIPEIAKNIPKKILQLHSSEYKNSKILPKGPVLVIGAGNSGIQIADDLNKAGRIVYQSISKLRIVPRSYRGKDFMEWAKLMGTLDRTVDEATPEIKSLAPPLLFGNNQTVNFRKLSKNGIALLGRLKDFQKNKLIFDNSLEKNLQKGEDTLVGFKKVLDQFIVDNKINTPKE